MSKVTEELLTEEGMYEEFLYLRDKADWPGMMAFRKKLKAPICRGDVCEDYSHVWDECVKELTDMQFQALITYELSDVAK